MTLGQEKSKSLRILEQIYALVGLLHMIGASEPFFLDYNSEGVSSLSTSLVTEGTLGMQISGAIIYLIAMILVLPRLNSIMTLLKGNKAFVLFMVLILASALWSELPSVTLRRSVALTGTTIFAIYLALRFKPSEFMIMLAAVLAFTAIENLLFVFLVPDVAIHQYSNFGAWKGALGHKNIMGRTMVLCILVMWAVAPQARSYKVLLWSIIAICLVLIAMSQSRTSWIAGAGLFLAIPFLRYLQRSQIPLMARVLFVALIGLGGLGVLVAEYADVGLQAVGRDATFTGRTEIWASAIEVGGDKPILGHGYRTFWTLGLTNRLLIGNGHNSFIDLWVELGLAGVVLFFTTMIVTGRRALQRLARSNDRRGQWYIMYLLFMVVFGMAAQVFPDHGTIAWVLYVVITLYLTPFAVARQTEQTDIRDRRAMALGQPSPAE